jgi:hypothetical protein
LTPNPVFFGALMAGGAALVAAVASLPFACRVLGVVVFAAATDLSGSRVALATGFVATALVLMSRTDVVSRWRRALLPVAFVGGAMFSTILTALNGGAVGDGTRTSTDRIADVGSGGRPDAWRYGIEAAADRPVFGWGFGRFRAATQGYFDAGFVRSSALDDVRQSWFDAHNIVLTLVVSVGLVGLVIAILFVIEAVRPARGPLVLFAIGVAGTWVLQPAGLATLPVVALALGSAVPRAACVDQPTRMRGWSVAVAGLLGGVLASWLAVADLRLQRAADPVDAAAVDRAASWFPGDSLVADLAAQAWFLEHVSGTPREQEVLTWSRRAISREPDRPYYWAQYAGRLIAFERYDEARTALDEALRRQPWHAQSWRLMYNLSERTNDEELRLEAGDRLCELGVEVPECTSPAG